MKHIYRNKENLKLYYIEYLITDIKHLNNNSFSGIYAHPYNWQGEIIEHTKQMFNDNEIEYFEPYKFIEKNFEIVCELR